MNRYARILVILIPFVAGGCLIIPNPAIALQRHHITEKIGDSDSDAPIKKGISGRSDVIKVFGKPGIYDFPDVWSFYETRTTGVLIWLWPFVHGGFVQRVEIRIW